MSIQRCWATGLMAVLVLATISKDMCCVRDPKIFPIALEKVNISDQIDPTPQGGEMLLPLPKLDYKYLQERVRGSASALLADGADPNATSDKGTPILFDVIFHHTEPTELENFLRAGADPNKPDHNGYSPLRAAMWRKNEAAVKLLLEYGADPKLKYSGETAIDYARDRYPELVGMLESPPQPLRKPTVMVPPHFLRKPVAVIGSTLFRSPTGGEAVIYSADGRRVIAGGTDGAIRFFDASSGEVVNVIAAHDHEISELATIPGSDLIISSNQSETKFWDTKTSCELLRLKGGGRGLSVSRDGRWVFNGLHLWQIESPQPLKLAARGRGYPQANQKVFINWSFFTPDHRYLIFSVQGGYVYVWNLSNDFVRRIGNLKSEEMRSLKWGDLRGSVDIEGAVHEEHLALATDQYTMLTGPSEVLKAVEPWLAKVSEPRSLACSPDGQYLAAVGYDTRIDIYDIQNGARPFRHAGHTTGISAVAASPDGKLVASAGYKEFRLWDRVTGTPIKLISANHYVASLTFSGDGRRLIMGDEMGYVYLLDMSTGDVQKRSIPGRLVKVMADDQGELWFIQGRELIVMRADSGEKLASIPSEGSTPGMLAVTPGKLIIGCDNGMLATESYKVPLAWLFDDNRLVRKHDLFSHEMGHRSPIHALATSRDGGLLAAASNSAIRLWDLEQAATCWLSLDWSHAFCDLHQVLPETAA